MQIDILYRPSYSLAKISLEGGEEVRVEGGSMVSMSHGINLETDATGGLWRSLGRSLFGGETFFQKRPAKRPPGAAQCGSPQLCLVTC